MNRTIWVLFNLFALNTIVLGCQEDESCALSEEDAIVWDQRDSPMNDAGVADQWAGIPNLVPSDYNGMSCIAWQGNEDGTLDIALLAYPWATVDWHGFLWADAQVSDNNNVVINLYQQTPGCYAVSPYLTDLKFTIEDIDLNSDLTLNLMFQEKYDSSGDMDRLLEELTLTLSKDKSGLRCRRIDDWHLEMLSYSSLFALCGSKQLQSTCNPGLICVPDADSNTCHRPCEVNEDCLLPVLTCRQDGRCGIADEYYWPELQN